LQVDPAFAVASAGRAYAAAGLPAWWLALVIDKNGRVAHVCLAAAFTSVSFIFTIDA
jgi:hypothetical protein